MSEERTAGVAGKLSGTVPAASLTGRISESSRVIELLKVRAAELNCLHDMYCTSIALIIESLLRRLA